MPTLRRRNAWTWGKPCSCCAQFDADQKNKKTRAARQPPPPPETVQVVTVPTEPYPNLHSIITRTMDSYYGYGSPYGGMVGHDSYNPWHSARG